MAYTQDSFDWQAYIASHPNSNISQGGSADAAHEGKRAYQDYVANGSSWLNTADQAAANAASASQTPGQVKSIVPGTATGAGQQNVADYAAQMAANPSSAVDASKGTSLTAATAGQTAQAAQISDAEAAASQVKTNDPSTKTTASTVAAPTTTAANTYTAATTADAVKNNQLTAAQGAINQNDLVTAAQVDVKAIADGTDANGVGKALQAYASQNMSTIIDTSTSSGQLLAAQLGDGNYTDSKATVQGQLALLQSQFVDPTTGEPKIPAWAAATARNVSSIMAFSGVTGTAATAAMSQALMEASLPIATSDASFFQTLTVTNLNNKQQATINTANTLAKFEQSNLDNRQAAAVQNAQSFLAMDLKNLDNKQQAAVVNNQSYIQSIMTDANAQNVQRQFTATSKNQTDQFYATLGTQVATFNASQLQSASQFNASMEDSRQKYNATNAYNIAVSNANWRQAASLQDDAQAFQAATTDVKTATDMQTQELNEIWDRSDSLLDYAFQASQNDANRATTLATAQLQAKTASKGATASAIGSVAGAVVGQWAGSPSGSSTISNLFKGF